MSKKQRCIQEVIAFMNEGKKQTKLGQPKQILKANK